MFEFLADPFGIGNSFLSGLGKSLGFDNNESIDKSIASLDEIKEMADSLGSANRRMYGEYMDRMNGMYGDNASKYSDAVARLADAIGNYGDFEFKGSVEDYLDPARNQRVAAAMSAINKSAASGGNRFSSNYLDKVAAKQQALASEEWRSAYDRMMRERSQQLAEWQSGQNRINNLGTLAGIYGQDRSKLGDALGDYYSNMANQNNADLEVYSDVAQNKANLDAQRSSGIGGALGTIARVAGAIFG